jgi:hypothetical protein
VKRPLGQRATKQSLTTVPKASEKKQPTGKPPIPSIKKPNNPFDLSIHGSDLNSLRIEKEPEVNLP